MSYTYSTYTTALAELMVTASTDANFTAILPSIIDYAEQRIYRELDLLDTTITVTSTLAASARTLTLPSASGTFITVQYINVITPSSADTATGTRVPLVPVSRESVDMFWPNASSYTGTPQMFAMQTSSVAVFGPSPNSSYPVEIVGTIRPTALSSSNSSTLLTTYLPDLFMAASMVFASGYMRDFGAQADNPQMSQSWESQYQLLKASADAEQARQKFQGWGWTSGNTNAGANVKRT